MGGGGGGTTYKPVYEPERVSVAKRNYGELSSNGFQSQEDFDAKQKFIQNYKHIPRNEVGEPGIVGFAERLAHFRRNEEEMKAIGLKYNEDFDRWTLANGVDYQSAVDDWGNYTSEREEIAQYEAKEERRKSAPKDLAGTSGKVDYSLAIKQNDKQSSTDKKKKKIDKSPSTASTNQSLGIY